MTLHTTAARLRTVDLVYVALFSVLIAVCAWISIPATIPFTLQTFGIFAALTILGGRRGLTPPWSICCWVLWDFRFSPGFRQESALCWALPAASSWLCRTGPGLLGCLPLIWGHLSLPWQQQGSSPLPSATPSAPFGSSPSMPGAPAPSVWAPL